jgi:FADH2 O2-dependent halogenase
MIEDVDFDIGIIGGGPAGSATGGYLAKAGLRVAIFEREMFPRAHVGESLVPASNRVLEELGVWEEITRSGFPVKTGAAWSANAKRAGHGAENPDGRGRILAYARFEGQTSTFHVDRGRFDLILLQHARNLGVEVFTGTRVKDVDFSRPDRPRIRLGIGHQEMGVRVRMVVDASGRRTLLGSQLKLKANDPVFDQYAVHTWFDGYERLTFSDDPVMNGFIFIHFLPLSNSWVWQIPITETITSVGVVSQRAHLRGRDEHREAFFWECIDTYPELGRGLRRARRVRPFTVEADYSYAMREICGDGFLMVGDAARFVDPIFSSGVSVALNGARLASRDIIAAAEAGDFRKPRFRDFEAAVRRGLKNWYEFISLYYRLNILFATFLQDPRYHSDVFELLQGNVYDEKEREILKIMRRTVTEVESNPDHPWYDLLGTLSARTFQETVA